MVVIKESKFLEFIGWKRLKIIQTDKFFCPRYSWKLFEQINFFAQDINFSSWVDATAFPKLSTQIVATDDFFIRNSMLSFEYV